MGLIGRSRFLALCALIGMLTLASTKSTSLLGFPEIRIMVDGMEVNLGATFEYREVASGYDTKVITSVLKNTRASDLSLPDAVAIGGTDRLIFTVLEQPAGTINPGEQNSFIIRFSPTGEAKVHTAIASIVSNALWVEEE